MNPVNGNVKGLSFKRRLWPLFVAQFGGALNDNFFKSALLMLFTFGIVDGSVGTGVDTSVVQGEIDRFGLSINVINNLVAAALIVPFFLFAAMMGQFADKYEKTALIRVIKIAEIMIMLLGALALWLNSPLLLLGVLFLTGTQSACFSPLKYGIVPQLVNERELIVANSWLHMGTSLAIFLGLIIGSVVIVLPGGRQWMALAVLVIAVLGCYASYKIPLTSVSAPSLKIERNPLRQTWRVLVYARENTTVFGAIIGLSWYWFLGSTYLTQLPNFTRTVLSGAPSVVTLLLGCFLVGTCTGALLCGKLSARRVEPGVSLLGAVGIALFGFDLFYSGAAFSASSVSLGHGLLSVSDFLSLPLAIHIALDVAFLGVCGGLYMVPLSALMQERSRPERRAQVVAANNVINALFMVLSALAGAWILGVLQLSIPQLFLWLSAAHIVVIVLFCLCLPEFPSAAYRLLAKVLRRGD